jgi:hypothetical protein
VKLIAGKMADAVLEGKQGQQMDEVDVAPPAPRPVPRAATPRPVPAAAPAEEKPAE